MIIFLETHPSFTSSSSFYFMMFLFPLPPTTSARVTELFHAVYSAFRIQKRVQSGVHPVETGQELSSTARDEGEKVGRPEGRIPFGRTV